MRRRGEQGGGARARDGDGDGAGDSARAEGKADAGRRQRGWLACCPRLRTLLLHLLLIYISVPFLIRLFPVLLTKFVYLNFLAFPFFVDFRRPELLLNNTINLYLTTEPDVTVGIWHTVPSSRGDEAQGKDQRWYEEALADAHPIIIYLHGNGGTRAASHRVQFLKTMGAAGFHILALDYRGYGDSSGYPTESGFTTDVLALYDWAKARSGNSSILFWGHSLGTGIATNAARKLQEERGVQVDAVVLESPYPSIREAAAHIPISKIYRQFPGFEYFILDSLALGNMFFCSDENVKVLTCPLLILHAEDDAVLPLHLAHKLFETARSTYKDKTKVKFITFPKKLGLGHDYISFNPELPALVKDFLNIQ
ncbi:lysophosphatidylserine lipase ABHD12-like [Falco biarmicus]|uniref:lysophosphatidylserine lipase ABHD12-like n=1 Tax=Falco cherrug TaxID=345164 RepID=UPI001886A46C|nr:lysophosphatidylserine lipase ABHD12-like isoform X1 [Falco rusticolus]XP_055572452.1 lysophosphatidylserine lipase ABHD12-like [Falco cherrug]XP_055653112.1 lysophosphatidylserine lipase ABHD12 [Falco peregrinus]XP_056202673.1 lysophosphatidylserine lipase ABHD12-like [Falco biarmicus]